MAAHLERATPSAASSACRLQCRQADGLSGVSRAGDPRLLYPRTIRYDYVVEEHSRACRSRPADPATPSHATGPPTPDGVRSRGGDVYKYILRRLLQMIPVLLGCHVHHLCHGLRPARRSHGRHVRRAALPAGVRRRVPRRSTTSTTRCRRATLNYMGNLVQGDLGTNFRDVEVVGRARAALPHDREARRHGDHLRDGHRHHRRCAGGHPQGQVHRQPRPGEHPVRHRHPDLRHRRHAAVLPRRQSQALPGHRVAQRRRSTSCSSRPSCSAAPRSPTSRG